MGQLQDTARTRQIETMLGMVWYLVSASTFLVMASSSSALAAIPGFEDWGTWLGRIAILPATGTLGGLAFLIRHQWTARRDIDRLVPPRIDQREPTVVFTSVVIIATLAWGIRPVFDPLAFAFGGLLLSVPLGWIGVRAYSRSTWWVWALLAFTLPASAALVALQIRYGSLRGANLADLNFVVGSVLSLSAFAIVLGLLFLFAVAVGFARAQRMWNRGELEALSKLSFWGLVEDSPRVLDALRMLGDTAEVEARYRRVAAVLPLPGAASVLAACRADAGDPTASALAQAAVNAYPLSVQALQVFARVHRRDASEEALDAVITAQSRGLGGAARTPVFVALEACILAHQGQAHAARQLLDALAFGEHPVHAQEARLYAAEAHLALRDSPTAAELLAQVSGIPALERRAEDLLGRTVHCEHG